MEECMASVCKRKIDQNRRGSRWIVQWYDAEAGKWRSKLGYVDKGSSLALGERLEKESSQRAEGIITPAHEQSVRPIEEHLAEFIAHLRGKGRGERYVDQVEMRIKCVIEACRFRRIALFDATKIEVALVNLRVKGRPLSPRTRNDYIADLKAFARWAVRARRVEFDPLASLDRFDLKNCPPVHPRRALSPEQLSRLLDAAEKRPLDEVMLIRHGPRAGQLLAKVRPWVIEKRRLLGRERRLCYMIAIWAGLRRAEIKALCWGDVLLELAVPCIRLRAVTTKSKRADTLALHPQLAEELRAMRPANFKPTDRVVATVPDMKSLIADLKAAGIDYGDQTTGFADLHSLRVTCNTLMASSGMGTRLRQTQMRHTDPRLTEITYLDEKLLPIAQELSKVPAIPVANSKPLPRPAISPTPTEMLRKFREAQRLAAKADALGQPTKDQSDA